MAAHGKYNADKVIKVTLPECSHVDGVHTGRRPLGKVAQAPRANGSFVRIPLKKSAEEVIGLFAGS